MALAITSCGFNGTSQPWPHMNSKTQEVLSLFRIIFEPGPRSATAFSSVAVSAGSHEISRRVVTAFHKRLNVVERKLAVGENCRAVDATVGIAAENISALVVACL